MTKRMDQDKLQIIWGSVRLLRQRVNAQDWLNAFDLYRNLVAFEDTGPDEDARLLNLCREACEYYVEKYNQWLKQEVFHYA